MRREDVQQFHEVANPTRDAVYGVDAKWGNRSINISCHVLTDFELAAGGWERNGIMRALYTGLDGPQEHDHLLITDPKIAAISTKWVVKSITPSIPHNSTAYVLEPV